MVPPFAGLIHLSPMRTLVPMGVASAIWYGSITMLGSVIGAEWGRLNHILVGVNRTLGIVAGVLVLLGLIVYLRNRRRRQRERVWHATREALDPATPTFLAGSEIAEGSAQQAAALLVLELAYADTALTEADREAVAAHLRDRWGLSPQGQPLPEPELIERLALPSTRSDYAGVSARISDSLWWNECGRSRSVTVP